MVVTRGKGHGRVVRGKGVTYMVTEDLTLGGGHAMKYRDNVYCLIITL